MGGADNTEDEIGWHGEERLKNVEVGVRNTGCFIKPIRATECVTRILSGSGTDSAHRRQECVNVPDRGCDSLFGDPFPMPGTRQFISRHSHESSGLHRLDRTVWIGPSSSQSRWCRPTARC